MDFTRILRGFYMGFTWILHGFYTGFYSNWPETSQKFYTNFTRISIHSWFILPGIFVPKLFSKYIRATFLMTKRHTAPSARSTHPRLAPRFFTRFTPRFMGTGISGHPSCILDRPDPWIHQRRLQFMDTSIPTPIHGRTQWRPRPTDTFNGNSDPWKHWFYRRSRYRWFMETSDHGSPDSWKRQTTHGAPDLANIRFQMESGAPLASSRWTTPLDNYRSRWENLSSHSSRRRRSLLHDKLSFNNFRKNCHSMISDELSLSDFRQTVLPRMQKKQWNDHIAQPKPKPPSKKTKDKTK